MQTVHHVRIAIPVIAPHRLRPVCRVSQGATLAGVWHSPDAVQCLSHARYMTLTALPYDNIDHKSNVVNY